MTTKKRLLSTLRPYLFMLCLSGVTFNAFADGFGKLAKPKRRKIAILKGNKQLEDKYIANFVQKLGEYYYIAPFTLDSVASNPQKTSKALNDFDLIISAKPTEAFSEKEKLVLDQFTMKGGKSLWLLDAVAIEKDSLYNPSGKGVATARNLNLTDFFILMNQPVQ